jgi:histidinol-phosphate aminotransferase
MSVLDLARPHLRGVEAYKSARLLAADGDVFLDANESPRVLSGDAALEGLNRYPAPQPPRIVAEAARYYGVSADRVIVTRGADEGIDLLVRAFTEPGREEILITPPTYGVYAIAARLHGAGVSEAPLDPARGFALDSARVLSSAKSGPVKLVFICRPNNPTATGVPLETVEAVAKELAERALVVVDEAYLEFCDAPSATELLDRLPNIVVLKTLSKAWGLAGARCGFLIADPSIAALMQVVRAPYPISAAAARAVESVFTAEGEKAMRRSVADILSERSRLMAAFAQLSCVTEVLPSEANFFLARFNDAKAALTALRSQGILVRDRSSEPGLASCIRVTVGSAQENDRLLAALETL